MPQFPMISRSTNPPNDREVSPALGDARSRVDRLVEEARLFARYELAERARACLDRALELDPFDRRARLLREILGHDRDPRHRSSGNADRGALLRIGLALSRTGLAEEAHEALEALADDPTIRAAACEALGNCELADQRPREALRWFLTGLEAEEIPDPELAGLLQGLAVTLRRLGRLDDARKVLACLRELVPLSSAPRDEEDDREDPLESLPELSWGAAS